MHNIFLVSPVTKIDYAVHDLSTFNCLLNFTHYNERRTQKFKTTLRTYISHNNNMLQSVCWFSNLVAMYICMCVSQIGRTNLSVVCAQFIVGLLYECVQSHTL